MRLTSEFLRHAEKHVDIKDERKKVYIRATCDELRKLSDDQLNLALMKPKFGVTGLDSEAPESQKRKFGVAGLDSEASGTQHTLIHDHPHLQSSSAPFYSRSIDTESAITQSLSAMTPSSHVVGIANTYTDMSYSTEAQPQPDVLGASDSVPTLMNTWTTDSHRTTNPVNEVLETSRTQWLIVADQPHLQGSSQAHLDFLRTFDAPILQTLNSVPGSGAHNYGSKAPIMYSNTARESLMPSMYPGSETPAMYSGTVLGAKAPIMHSGTVFGSRAPVMYSGTALGSASFQVESSVHAPQMAG